MDEGKSRNRGEGNKLVVIAPVVEELPNEVLLRCLSFLSATDLLTCQRVSQGWREVAQDRSLWRGLMGTFLRTSPFVCVNDSGPQPADGDSWQSVYFRLMRLVYMKGRLRYSRPYEDQSRTALRRSRTSSIILPSCPFCGVMMCQPEVVEESHAGGGVRLNCSLMEDSWAWKMIKLIQTVNGGGKQRKLLICCECCNLYVWINSCERCGQAATHLNKCELCTSDVCPRCYGSCGKRCEQCNTNGCRECVRPKATFAETNQRAGAGPRSKKSKRKAKRASAVQLSHEPACKAALHLCVYCGVTCIACERTFESEDADFCVACESAVCYSCDCPCGALDMFQEIRV